MNDYITFLGVSQAQDLIDWSILRRYSVSEGYAAQNIRDARIRLYTEIIHNDQNYHAQQRQVQLRFDPNAWVNKTLSPSETLYTRNNPLNDASSRELSKYRTLTSPVTFYADGRLQRFNVPQEVVVTTACGINLMGTSPVDFQRFIQVTGIDAQGRQIGVLSNPQDFKNTYKLMFTQFLRAQDAAGVNVCGIPLFGGGVYLSQLEPQEKPVALQLINEALKETLETEQFNNLQQVLYCLPNDATSGPNPTFDNARSDFNNYSGTVNLSVAPIDILDTDLIQQVTAQGLRYGVLNPSSDKAPGGGFQDQLQGIWAPPGRIPKATIEELIAHVSNLTLVQTADYNPALQNLAPPFLQQVAQASVASRSFDPGAFAQFIAEAAKLAINTPSTVRVGHQPNANGWPVSFNTYLEAQSFRQVCQQRGIILSNASIDNKSQPRYFIISLQNAEAGKVLQSFNPRRYGYYQQYFMPAAMAPQSISQASNMGPAGPAPAAATSQISHSGQFFSPDLMYQYVSVTQNHIQKRLNEGRGIFAKKYAITNLNIAVNDEGLLVLTFDSNLGIRFDDFFQYGIDFGDGGVGYFEESFKKTDKNTYKVECYYPYPKGKGFQRLHQMIGLDLKQYHDLLLDDNNFGLQKLLNIYRDALTKSDVEDMPRLIRVLGSLEIFERTFPEVLKACLDLQRNVQGPPAVT